MTVTTGPKGVTVITEALYWPLANNQGNILLLLKRVHVLTHHAGLTLRARESVSGRKTLGRPHHSYPTWWPHSATHSLK